MEQSKVNYWPLDTCNNSKNIYPKLTLPGRKVMTNLDGILKSRDISLPAKVHLVKAMLFLIGMYGCESRTIKKVSGKELMLSNCGVGEDS